MQNLMESWLVFENLEKSKPFKSYLKKYKAVYKY